LDKHTTSFFVWNHKLNWMGRRKYSAPFFYQSIFFNLIISHRFYLELNLIIYFGCLHMGILKCREKKKINIWLNKIKYNFIDLKQILRFWGLNFKQNQIRSSIFARSRTEEEGKGNGFADATHSPTYRASCCFLTMHVAFSSIKIKYSSVAFIVSHWFSIFFLYY